MTKKEKDAEKFAKNTVELEQHLGRDLRPDEVMLLALFASVVNASEEDEKDSENTAFHINGRHNGKDLFFKKIAALEQRFGRGLRPDEALLLMIFDSLKVDCEKEEDLFLEKAKELVKRFGRKLKSDEAILLAMFGSIEITEEEKADLMNSILSDELDKMLKAESEKKKGSSNHEFSDAIAEAALEICGIDLKKEDKHD